jgi:hypothetical protein
MEGAGDVSARVARAEVVTVYAVGLFQGLALVALPAAQRTSMAVTLRSTSGRADLGLVRPAE